jgi:GNAT superfamily N-acetyltransferase
MYGVFREAIGELYRRHSFSPPDVPEEAFVAQQGHLLRYDAERCFVAEERGRVVAYTAALLRERTWFFSSLFVVPSYQGRGLGTVLLDRAWSAAADRRLTLTDAIQPVSNTLYARRGLIPVTPMLTLDGTPRLDGDDGLEAAAPHRAALADLDRAAYGFDRTPEHAHWSEPARATLWLRRGEPVAYSYAWPSGRIGPVAGTDGRSAASALAGELVRREGERAVVVVPGSSGALVETALRAGLRIMCPPGLLLSSPPRGLPDSLAIASYTLL